MRDILLILSLFSSCKTWNIQIYFKDPPSHDIGICTNPCNVSVQVPKKACHSGFFLAVCRTVRITSPHLSLLKEGTYRYSDLIRADMSLDTSANFSMLLFLKLPHTTYRPLSPTIPYPSSIPSHSVLGCDFDSSRDPFLALSHYEPLAVGAQMRNQPPSFDPTILCRARRQLQLVPRPGLGTRSVRSPVQFVVSFHPLRSKVISSAVFLPSTIYNSIIIS